MSEAYNDALKEQAEKSMWETLKTEAADLPTIEKATLMADVAGIFDPTPISDGTALALSLAQGDFLGAGLSLVSFVPYVGDSIAKPLKIATRAPRAAKAIETLLKHGDNLARAGEDVLKQTFRLDQVAAARKKALERVQQALLDAKNKVPGCKDCELLTFPDGKRRRKLDMPTTEKGTWKDSNGNLLSDQPTDGNGFFEFETPRELPDGTQVDSIEFVNGAPNFDDYVVGEKYEIWEVTGDVGKDQRSLIRDLSTPDQPFTPPDSSQYVLHHFEDGAVGYVPRALHDKGAGGVAHTGGNSMVNNDLF